MKTKLTVFLLVFAVCPVLRADTDTREITPEKAQELGWKIEVREEEGYVAFTLQLPASLLSQKRTAGLSVWHDRELITSCILGLHKRQAGDRYEFAVSKKYLRDSQFELGPKASSTFDAVTYRVHLAKFVAPVPIAAAVEIPKIEGRGDWGPETLGLVCRFTTDRTEYTIGDKVYILVEVKNNTDKPVALGMEPLIVVGKGALYRQPARIDIDVAQGDPGFFLTTGARFPKGTEREARAVIVKPGETFSEIIVRTPWGPRFSSFPIMAGDTWAEAQPGEMQIFGSLRQFLTPDLKVTIIKTNSVTIKVSARKK